MLAVGAPLVAFACATDDSPFGDGAVRLVFGERPGGTIVHVAEVRSGLACDCRCPACGGILVAHKGDARRYHFVHYAVRDCCGSTETSLHKLAKQILNEEKRLRVPEVRAEDAGESLLKYPEKDLSLDHTVLERRLEDIVPDVIARKGDRELLVEIAVTHTCDAQKIERIRRLGIAAIEIDLSGIALTASKEAVVEAILRTAPRQWLFNPKLDEAHAELRASRARKARNARSRKDRRVSVLLERIRYATQAQEGMRDQDNELIRRITEEGYTEVIGVPVVGDFCFRVSRRHWQAAILNAFALTHLRKPEWQPGRYEVRAKTVFKWVRESGLLRPELPSYVSEEIEDALRESLGKYQHPYDVVRTYLEHLEEADILRAWSGGAWTFSTKLIRAWDDRRRVRGMTQGAPGIASRCCGPPFETPAPAAGAGSSG